MIKYEVEIYSNGTEVWHLDGKISRIGAPAWIDPVIGQFWYLGGKLHRDDGPACEYSGGNKRWFINGKELDIESLGLDCATT